MLRGSQKSIRGRFLVALAAIRFLTMQSSLWTFSIALVSFPSFANSDFEREHQAHSVVVETDVPPKQT